MLIPSDVDDIENNWSRQEWFLKSEELLSLSPGLSASAVRHLGAKFKNAILDGLGSQARDWLIFSIAATGGQIVEDPRLTDVLKPSAYESFYLHKLAWALRSAILWSNDHLPAISLRLTSMFLFVKLSQLAKSDEKRVFQKIKKQPWLMAISLILTEESFFSRDNEGLQPLIVPYALAPMSPEHIALATSLLLAVCIKEKLIFSERKLAIPERWEKYIDPTVCLIKEAYSLHRLRELEVSVYRFGYSVSERHQIWRIIPPSPEFGIALSHGYLRTDIQAVARLANLPDGLINVPAFGDFCESFEDKLNEVIGQPLFRMSIDRPRRLQIIMHEGVSKILSENVLLSSALFREELFYINDLCHELFAEIDDLLELEIVDGLTVFDLLKISRLLRFYSNQRRKALIRLMKSDDHDAYFWSLLSTTKNMNEFLNFNGVTSSQSEAVLSIMRYSVVEDGRVDLQYTPIIELEDQTITLPAVLNQSNTIRNSLFRSKRRLYEDGTKDPLSEKLVGALRERFADVELEWKFPGGAVDVLAVAGGIIFIFECKKTLLPCSSFERRTFIDYIAKGSLQLTRFVDLWSNEEFRADASKRLGHDVTDFRVVTCIVPSIRLLSGVNYCGHPIRSAHELCNFISTGKAVIQTEKGRYNMDMYRGEPFGPLLLENWLKDTSRHYTVLWDATTEVQDGFGTKSWQIEEPIYVLDPDIHQWLLCNDFPMQPA